MTGFKAGDIIECVNEWHEVTKGTLYRLYSTTEDHRQVCLDCDDGNMMRIRLRHIESFRLAFRKGDVVEFTKDVVIWREGQHATVRSTPRPPSRVNEIQVVALHTGCHATWVPIDSVRVTQRDGHRPDLLEPAQEAQGGLDWSSVEGRGIFADSPPIDVCNRCGKPGAAGEACTLCNRFHSNEALSVQPILTAAGDLVVDNDRAIRAEVERDDLKQQVGVLTEMHKAACVKHDAMKEERDTARAVEQEIQRPDHLRVGDEAWDQVTRDGPYRVVAVEPDTLGRIKVYRGHDQAEDALSQGGYSVYPATITKELPPLPPSWWDRHWRKIAIPVAAICGSAALVNGLLAMSANGLLP